MMDRQQLLRPGLNSASGAKLLIGPLLKHGHKAFTSWKLRWFVLDDETLRYWATPESEVGEGELGRIDLKDIIKMDTTGIAPSKSEVDLAFTVHATDRVFQLCAADLKSKQEWLGALTFNIRLLNASKDAAVTAPEAASRLRRAATAVQPITISPRRNTAAAGGSEVNKDKSASAASSPRGGGGSSSAASSPRGGSGAVPRAASPPRATSPRSATVSTRPGSYLPPRRVTLGRISDSDVDAVAVDAVPPQRKSPEPLAGPRVPELRLHVALVSPRDGPRKSPDPTPRKSPEPSPRLAEPAAAQPRVHFGAPTVAAVDVRPARGEDRLYAGHEQVAHAALFSEMASEADDQELLDEVQVMIDDLYASSAPPEPDTASSIDFDNASTEVLELGNEFAALMSAPAKALPKSPPQQRRRP